MDLSLSNDVIGTEILSRVPAKMLLGFKCVSKGWQRLISDPTFIRLQFQRSKAVSGFFFQARLISWLEDIKYVSYIPIGMEQSNVQHTLLHFLPEKVAIMASSNGLICCRSGIDAKDPTIYVCNPSNKQWVGIKWMSNELGVSFGLAYNPFCHPSGITSSFKVVCVHQVHRDSDLYFSFEIYSETGARKMSNEICHCNYGLFKKNGIFCSGVLHWLTNGIQILAFNVEKEESQLIRLPVPTIQEKDLSGRCIGDSGDRLHYIQVSEFGLQVWILEEYSEPKWLRKCSITLAEMEEANPQFLSDALEEVARRRTNNMINWMVPLAFQDGLMFLRVSTKVFLYNLETKKMEELCTLGALGSDCVFSPMVLPFRTSLISVGSH